jgi:hypothetical protein
MHRHTEVLRGGIGENEAILLFHLTVDHIVESQDQDVPFPKGLHLAREEPGGSQLVPEPVVHSLSQEGSGQGVQHGEPVGIPEIPGNDALRVPAHPTSAEAAGEGLDGQDRLVARFIDEPQPDTREGIPHFLGTTDAWEHTAQQQGRHGQDPESVAFPHSILPSVMRPGRVRCYRPPPPGENVKRMGSRSKPSSSGRGPNLPPAHSTAPMEAKSKSTFPDRSTKRMSRPSTFPSRSM